MANTTNLVMPLMSAAQSQKHLTHNDAIVKLDVLVQLAVISAALTAPPVSPSEGDRYIVGSAATGAWATKDLNIAYYASGVWQFAVPREGWQCYNVATDTLLVWTGSAWTDLATAGGFVSTTTINNNTLPGKLTMLGLGGATADTTNRLSANTAGVLFNNAGTSIGVTLNKNAAGNDARFVFQTGFSTRALFGLLANDDFSISVSPDGSTFYSAMAIDKDTGNVAIGAGSDGTNRLLVSGTNMLFTSSGNLSFTFNKGASGDDCSLTFQAGFSARALVGLLGDDDFTFKVSPDGSSYKTGMVIDKDTGSVSFAEHSKFSAYVNFDRYVAANTWTLIDNNNARHNDQGDWASGLFTAPHDGYYLFGAGYRFKANSTVPTDIKVGLSVNAATPLDDRIATTGDATIVTLQSSVHITGLIKLTAGQTVSARAYMTGFDGYVEANSNYFWGCQIA